jgi:hypothetical protein
MPALQPKPDPKQSNDDLSFELRRSVNDAYAFVNGAQEVQSFAALTIEECLDQQIEQIEGKATPLRPNELDRLDSIEKNITAAVAKIKSLPDNYFAEQDATNNVNTEPEPIDEG